MLIQSPRLKGGDLAVWERRESYDRALAHTPRMDRLERDAIEAIQRFTTGRSGSVSVSWGKDSVCVAHLARMAGCDWPLVWVRVNRWENPDCPAVRDAFLERHPDAVLHEIVVEAAAPRRWEGGQGHKRTSTDGFRRAEREFGPLRIVGVRAEESADRALSAAVHGLATDRVCRPVLRWSAVDIFAFLARHDLPVHPAYAMSSNGSLDRRLLRVGSLGGSRGGPRRESWEQAYYPDVVGVW